MISKKQASQVNLFLTVEYTVFPNTWTFLLVNSTLFQYKEHIGCAICKTWQYQSDLQQWDKHTHTRTHTQTWITYLKWGQKVFSQPLIVQVLLVRIMIEICNFHHRYNSTMREKMREKKSRKSHCWIFKEFICKCVIHSSLHGKVWRSFMAPHPGLIDWF